MSDDFLSLTDTEKNRRVAYKNNNSFKEEIYIISSLGVLAIICLITYFSPSYLTDSDGETLQLLFYGLWVIGFVIGDNILKIIQRFQNRKLYEEMTELEENEGEVGIDAEFMGTYGYTSSRDIKWGNLLFAGAIGGVNIVIYLLFAAFIAR